jgi:hypothetical protein
MKSMRLRLRKSRPEVSKCVWHVVKEYWSQVSDQAEPRKALKRVLLVERETILCVLNKFSMQTARREQDRKAVELSLKAKVGYQSEHAAASKFLKPFFLVSKSHSRNFETDFSTVPKCSNDVNA